MIMDYIEGVSLADLLNDAEHLSPEQAIPIFLQICDALHAAHEQGIIHRDLKPGNVLVSGFGTSNMHVRLGDFGIAKLTKPLLDGQVVRTQHGEIFGSPSYMSPEQCMGVELDPLSDMYSMGCLMYCTLVGTTPVAGRDAMEVMYKKMSDEVKPIGETSVGSQLSPYLQAIIMKALRFSKFDRFNSIGSLKAILTDYL
ncbi:MAG: serine/threonine protein kinase, partial [Cyanobacteria bacterium]|nr:serine/threonine protein kinase [Cyanobacteriota bacterium]